ncbi:MAG: hypothetical protein K1X87_04420 [Dehalococcoidia bacterium]|nr:hypothetical protein [Dehalococcoidia bacterium]
MTGGGWASVTAFEGAATAGSGTLNAALFLERTARSSGPRRMASALLTGLSVAIALGAVAGGVADEGSALAALLEAPLAIANLGVTAVLLAGGRR